MSAYCNKLFATLIPSETATSEFMCSQVPHRPAPMMLKPFAHSIIARIDSGLFSYLPDKRNRFCGESLLQGRAFGIRLSPVPSAT